jgi:hypothetical protein
MATNSLGIPTARIADNKSGKGVVAVSNIAAWTETQDLKVMLRKRSNPSSDTDACHPPKFRENKADPGVMKINGSAASRKGSARAERRSTYPTPTVDKTTAEISIENNRI